MYGKYVNEICEVDASFFGKWVDFAIDFGCLDDYAFTKKGKGIAPERADMTHQKGQRLLSNGSCRVT